MRGPRTFPRFLHHLAASNLGRKSCFTMGRPKVDPANRLRANTACTACRASKKRCSGSFPCTNCFQKGRAQTCTPFKSSTSEAGSRTRLSQELAVWEASQNSLSSPLSSQVPGFSPPGLSGDQNLGPGSRSPEATHRTHPRMLRNLQGDQGVWIF